LRSIETRINFSERSATTKVMAKKRLYSNGQFPNGHSQTAILKRPLPQNLL